jgi:hypothetical protein
MLALEHLLKEVDGVRLLVLAERRHRLLVDAREGVLVAEGGRTLPRLVVALVDDHAVDVGQRIASRIGPRPTRHAVDES